MSIVPILQETEAGDHCELEASMGYNRVRSCLRRRKGKGEKEGGQAENITLRLEGSTMKQTDMGMTM